MWSARVRTATAQAAVARWSQAPRASASSFTRGRSAPSRRDRKSTPIGGGSTRQPSASKDATLSDTPEGNTGAPKPDYDPAQNTLLSPVYIPENPNGVLKKTHPAIGILANSGLVVQRQLEMMNVMIGFEQANKYVILDAAGNHAGYMAEQEKGMGNLMARQWFRTHRSFTTHVFDRHEREVLRFHRPFSWINSQINVYDPLGANQNFPPNPGVSPLEHNQMRIIGAAQQEWAPLRRKYNLFMSSPDSATEMKTSHQTQLTEANQDLAGLSQFAHVDEPFLSWDFSLRTVNSKLIGSVNRNFVGFAREIFTDTGVYALRMDSAALKAVGAPEQDNTVTNESMSNAVTNSSANGMTLDQRAVMLATAVSIDFDYFSRKSGVGGGFMPLWIPGIGGEAAAGGAGVAGGLGEGAAAGAAGAGAIAGYDAMSRGMAGSNQQQGGAADQQQPPPADPNSPTNSQTGPYGDPWAPEQKENQQEDLWKDDHDDHDGGAGGDGGGSDWSDFF
ncbi:Scramblase-domain-containing protein [Aspergillus filifer]